MDMSCLVPGLRGEILTDSASSRFDGSGRGSILLCSQHGDRQTAPAKRLSQPAHRTVLGRRCNGEYYCAALERTRWGWWGL